MQIVQQRRGPVSVFLSQMGHIQRRRRSHVSTQQASDNKFTYILVQAWKLQGRKTTKPLYFSLFFNLESNFPLLLVFFES